MNCRRQLVVAGNRGRPGISLARLRFGAIATLVVGVLFAGNIAAPLSAAELGRNGAIVSDGVSVQRVSVLVNKSRTFNVERPFARAIVGAVEFADVVPLSDRAIYVQGKKVGSTNVSLFDGNARLIGVLDLDIVLDTGNLQQQIRAGTGNSNIRISSLRGQIVVGGIAGDAVIADRAMQVARSVAGDTTVVNAMQIAPSQQVMLEVRFLEVSREAGRELGVNWFGANRNRTAGVRIGQGLVGRNTVAPDTPSGVPIFQTAGTLLSGSQPFGTILARAFSVNGANVDVLVTALEEKGLVRRLAEPNLIAISGEEARFHAGGEFPVPVPSTSGSAAFPTIAIEYKSFGVQLRFRPTVLSRGIINLRIQPEVSELDFANSVTISGTSVPALVKRDMVTTVELRDGQSYAVAGLLSTTRRQQYRAASVDRLGARARRAIPQRGLPAKRDRLGRHRHAAFSSASSSRTAACVAAGLPAPQ